MESMFLQEALELLPTATVVIVQNDPNVAQNLSKELHFHFAGVVVAEDVAELIRLLLRYPEMQVAVLDLDIVSVEDVK